MNTLAIHSERAALVKPEPRGGPISIRVAVGGVDGADFKFIDALQKKHSKMVGFLRTAEIEGHMKPGRVLIADDELSRPIGYCIYKDKYMGREDLGNVVQLNVEPHKHRGLIGAALIKAVFERVPYGVRLFCCWCAQDLAANHFWEAMGFVPLAYRTGARGKAHGGSRAGGTRMHIFWQRRVREGDDGVGGYPYWYPTETNNGPLKEARIVLPIQPGTHWSDAKPNVLPGLSLAGAEEGAAPLALQPQAPQPTEPPQSRRKRERNVKAKAKVPPPSSIRLGGLRFAPGKKPAPSQKEVEAKAKRERQPRQKNDPQLVAAAREFRDRYLEQVNAEGGDRLLASNGKYEVSRQLAAAPTRIEQVPLLNAA